MSLRSALYTGEGVGVIGARGRRTKGERSNGGMTTEGGEKEVGLDADIKV